MALLVAVFTIAAFVVAKGEVLTFAVSDLPKPPEVLAERSAEILARVGHEPAVDREFWYQIVPDSAAPASVRFIYRQSPRSLLPQNLLHFVTASIRPPMCTEWRRSSSIRPAI